MSNQLTLTEQMYIIHERLDELSLEPYDCARCADQLIRKLNEWIDTLQGGTFVDITS